MDLLLGLLVVVIGLGVVTVITYLWFLIPIEIHKEQERERARERLKKEVERCGNCGHLFVMHYTNMARGSSVGPVADGCPKCGHGRE